MKNPKLSQRRVWCALLFSTVLSSIGFSQPPISPLESIDLMVARSETIVVGRIAGISHPYANRREALFSIAVDETLKGVDSSVFEVRVSQLYQDHMQAMAHGRTVFVAVRKDESTAPLIAIMGATIEEMSKSDFTIVHWADELLSYVREILSMEPGPSMGEMTIDPPDTLVGLKWRMQFEEPPVWSLRVPIDKRLEKVAHEWLKSEDWHKRIDAVNVLRHFESPENIAALKSLLDDPGYSSTSADYNRGLERRTYMVRSRAHRWLKSWGVEVEEPVTRELIPSYGELQNVIWGRMVEEGELEVLLQSPKLWRLQFWADQLTGRVSERDLEVISKLSGLRELVIYGSKLTDEDLAYLAKLPNLTYLTIAGASITDAGIKHLAEIQKLAVLNIRSTQVTAIGWAELWKKLPNLYIAPDFRDEHTASR